MTNAAEPEHPPVLNTTEARQGRRGRHALWILIVSLFLVVIALFGSWISRSGDLAATNANNGARESDAVAFNAPEPAPRVVNDAVPNGSAYSQPDPQARQ